MTSKKARGRTPSFPLPDGYGNHLDYSFSLLNPHAYALEAERIEIAYQVGRYLLRTDRVLPDGSYKIAIRLTQTAHGALEGPPPVVDDSMRIMVEGGAVVTSVKSLGSVVAKISRDYEVDEEPRAHYGLSREEGWNADLLQQLLNDIGRSSVSADLRSLRSILGKEAELHAWVEKVLAPTRSLDPDELEARLWAISDEARKGMRTAEEERTARGLDSSFWTEMPISPYPLDSRRAVRIWNGMTPARQTVVSNLMYDYLLKLNELYYRIPSDWRYNLTAVLGAAPGLGDALDNPIWQRLERNTARFDEACRLIHAHLDREAPGERAFLFIAQFNACRSDLIHSVQEAMRLASSPEPGPDGASLIESTADLRRLLCIFALNIARCSRSHELRMMEASVFSRPADGKADGEQDHERLEDALMRYVDMLTKMEGLYQEAYEQISAKRSKEGRARHESEMKRLVGELAQVAPVEAEILRQALLDQGDHVVYKTRRLYPFDPKGQLSVEEKARVLRQLIDQGRVKVLAGQAKRLEAVIAKLSQLNESKFALLRRLQRNARGDAGVDELFAPLKDQTLHHVELDPRDHGRAWAPKRETHNGNGSAKRNNGYSQTELTFEAWIASDREEGTLETDKIILTLCERVPEGNLVGAPIRHELRTRTRGAEGELQHPQDSMYGIRLQQTHLDLIGAKDGYDYAAFARFAQEFAPSFEQLQAEVSKPRSPRWMMAFLLRDEERRGMLVRLDPEFFKTLHAGGYGWAEDIFRDAGACLEHLGAVMGREKPHPILVKRAGIIEPPPPRDRKLPAELDEIRRSDELMRIYRTVCRRLVRLHGLGDGPVNATLRALNKKLRQR